MIFVCISISLHGKEASTCWLHKQWKQASRHPSSSGNDRNFWSKQTDLYMYHISTWEASQYFRNIWPSYMFRTHEPYLGLKAHLAHYDGAMDYNSNKTQGLFMLITKLTDRQLHTCTQEWWYPVAGQLAFRLHVINFSFSFPNWDVAQCVIVWWNKIILDAFYQVEMEQKLILAV